MYKEERRKRKLDILMVKIKCTPKEVSLPNQPEMPNNNISPFPLYSFFSLLSSIRELKEWKKRGGEGWRKKEPTR